MFSENSLALARSVLEAARARGAHIVTAESCTAGLLAACLTEIPGSSDVVDRGVIVYSNRAKCDLLGVPPALLAAYGAVSRETARAMAEGALKRMPSRVAIAITGIAGPGGGTAEKPIGLVHFAAAREGLLLDEEHRFGDIGRSTVRLKSVDVALALLRRAL